MARDEFDLMDFRMAYLSQDIDVFVVGESSFDFRGRPKKRLFRDRQEQRLLPAHVKVVDIMINGDVLSSGNPEWIQDQARKAFLKRVTELFPSDAIFFSDIDEIPSVHQVRAARSIQETSFLYSVPMKMFYRRTNWELARERRIWKAPKLLRGFIDSDRIRSLEAPSIEGSLGCHFSYLDTDSAKLEAKLSNLAATEFNRPELSNTAFLSFCDQFGLDHLARADSRGLGLLIYRDSDEFNDVQQAAAVFRESWVGNNFRHAKLTRLLSAQIALLYRAKDARALSLINRPREWKISLILWLGFGPLLANTARLQSLAAKKRTKRLVRKAKRLIFASRS